jgi:hypothetical protein
MKDVQIGEVPSGGTQTLVHVAGAPTWKYLVGKNGEVLSQSAAGIGYTSVWFADEDLLAAGSAKHTALGLEIKFWDRPNEKWLMPKPVTVYVRR